jgi:hypothetical protein
MWKPLLESRPAFLKGCGAQLTRSLLATVRVGIALKKQMLIKGGSHLVDLIILQRGSIQVTMHVPKGSENRDTDRATGRDTEIGSEPSRRTGDSPSPVAKPSFSKSKSISKRMGKIRMLEKPGAFVSPADIYSGTKRCRFEVFSTAVSHLFLMDVNAVARTLDQFPETEAAKVSEALDAEHRAILESLERRGTTATDEMAKRAMEAPRASKARGSIDLPGPLKDEADATLEMKVIKMEADIDELVQKMRALKNASNQLPKVHATLRSKFASGKKSSSSVGFAGDGISEA